MARKSALYVIMDLVETYADAVNQGDGEALREVFHPKAQIIGRFEGALEWDGVEAFVAACEEGALPPESAMPPFEIHGIDVSGDTAVVRVATMWGALNFFDTLSLIRIDGRWQIVTRVFTYLG